MLASQNPGFLLDRIQTVFAIFNENVCWSSIQLTMSQRQDLVVEASREHLVENDLKQVKKYRLNHCATEFVSSESSVEGESDIQSEEEAEGENSPCIVSEEGSPLKAKAGDERPAMQGRGSTTGMPNEHHDQAYGNGYAWGWESPQVRF